MSTPQQPPASNEQQLADNRDPQQVAEVAPGTAGNPALARAAAHVQNRAPDSANGNERVDGTSSTLGDGGGMSGGSVLDSGSGS